MKLKQIVVLILFTSLSLCANINSSLNKGITFHYVLTSEKEKLGDITQHYLVDNKNLFVITHSKLKWGTGKNILDIEESAIEEYKGLSTLVQSESYTMDYDEKVLYKTSFNQKNDAYRIVVFEKKEVNASTEAMFKHYKENLKHKNIPEIRLKMKEVANTKVALNSFDTTENIFTFYLKKHGIKNPIKTLSFDELSIETTKVSDLGMVELNIDHKVVLTHYYKLKSKGKKPSYLWIADTHRDFPYVVRAKGSDESGDFELVLKTIN